MKPETLTGTHRSRPSIKEKYGLSGYSTELASGSSPSGGNRASVAAAAAKALADLSKPSLSRRPSIKSIEDSQLSSMSRRPSISSSSRGNYLQTPSAYQENTNRVPRPYSISYSPFDVPSVAGLRSARASPRASPVRDLGTSYSRYSIVNSFGYLILDF